MLTNAVAAPLSWIATGSVAEPVAGTGVWSAARTAPVSLATTPAITLPGAALAGGVIVSETRSFARGCSVTTTSDSVSQLAVDPDDADDA